MNPNELLAKLVSGELLVVVQQEPTKPVPTKPKLVPEEQELADSLVAIAKKYGKFNEDETGIWAGYEAAKDNVVAHIGVKCSNCALYEGNGVCKIIAQKVEDGGKCRFAVIPDGVVGGVYDPAKTPVVPVSSGKRKIKIKAEADKSASCPKATRDIATNLKNRAKAIKTAMYGPLNPAEPNDAYYKKLGSEWDVSPEQARKQTCGNCAMFIVTPEMKSCIESGVTGPKGKDEWEAIDAAGHLGYCEAFDFKCASKRTCRAWVTGGPITETKSVKIRPSVKALGATIGGNAAVTDAGDMIDRDGDGTIFDGTPDEQPVKRKPKQERSGSGQPYQRLDNSFLEKRRRRHVDRSLREQGITPTQGNQIQEMEDGSLQLYGRSDEEREARGQARADFTVEEDRKRFVNNQLRKRGIQGTMGPFRDDEERQARREAREEYDRRMNAGRPKKPSTGTPPQQDQEYPPGYVPGQPADRYPVPKPDTSWQDNEDRRNRDKRPVGRPVDRLPGAQPGYPKQSSPSEPQEEWDGIVRSRGMEWVSDRYPNRPGGANSPLRNDPKWIAEQIEKQRASKPPQRTGNRGGTRRGIALAQPDRTNISKAKPDTTNIGNARPSTNGSNGQTRRPDASFERGAIPSGSRQVRDAGFEPGAIPGGSRQVRDAGREPRNLRERLVTNVFKDDDEDRGRRGDPYVRNPSNRPTAEMPVRRSTRPTAKMPVYEPPKRTGGGRFNGPRDDDRRPKPATVNPREIPGRDVQKNPPSRTQPITRTPNPNRRNPDSDRDRLPRTGRSFGLERGN